MSLFTVNFTTPLGEIRGSVAVDKGPMHLAELVPTAYELTDILVRRAISREQDQGREISCGSGCGMCCRQMVPVSPPEAFYIMGLLDSMHPVERAQLMEKFRHIEKVLHKRKMIEILLRPDYSDSPVLALARQYFSLQIPCPFLINESCSIYAYRPVACREYNVTSPPQYCTNPYAYKVEKIPMPLPLSGPLSRLTARLTHESPRLIPLSLVPLWVSRAGELRWRQWPGLDLFQQFMDMLGSGR